MTAHLMGPSYHRVVQRPAFGPDQDLKGASDIATFVDSGDLHCGFA